MDTNELFEIDVTAKCQWSSIFVQSMFEGKPSGYRLSLEVGHNDSVDLLLNYGIAQAIKGTYKNSRSERDGKVYWSVSNRNPFPVYDSKGANMRTKGSNIRVMDKYFNGSTVRVSLTAKYVRHPGFGRRILLIADSVTLIKPAEIKMDIL